MSKFAYTKKIHQKNEKAFDFFVSLTDIINKQ